MPSLRTPPSAQCHYSLARLLVRGGFLAEAAKAVRPTIDLYTDIGNPFKIFECHLLANISWKKEDLDGARDSLLAAAKIIRRLEEKHEFPMVLYDLYRLYLAQDNYLVANRSLVRSEDVYKAIHGDLQSGEESLMKSRLSFMRGDSEEAKAEANLALKMFRKTGHNATPQRSRRLIQWELGESLVPPSPVGTVDYLNFGIYQSREPIPTLCNPVPSGLCHSDESPFPPFHSPSPSPSFPHPYHLIALPITTHYRFSH